MEKMPQTIRGSIAIAGASFAIAILFNWLVWDTTPGLGLSLYVLCLIAGFLGLSQYLRTKVPNDAYWLLGVLTLFAVLISVRANMLLVALNSLACILLILLILEARVRGGIRDFRPLDYLVRLFPPFYWIAPLIQTTADLVALRSQTRNHARAAAITRGLLITIPVLVLFIALFSSADPVFGKFFTDIFSLNISEETIGHIVVTSIITIILIAGYSYTYRATSEPITYQTPRWLGNLEGSILFGSINALFFAFIIVQITYFFGGSTNITVAGLTYAEYARRGFFELLAISAISYLLLLATESFIQRDTEKHAFVFQALSVATALQVCVIMASSFMRLSLYEEAFGFTTLRLYSHAFILFLVVVFGILLYKILVDTRENTFAFRTFIAVAGFVLCMNVFNPDAFIAHKNLERYQAVGKIDVEYLHWLSADAHSALLETFDATTGETKAEIGHMLWSDIETDPVKWQSWNYSRAAAQKDLRARANELAQYQFASTSMSMSE